MIQTTVENWDAYAAVNPHFAKAFAAMKRMAAEPFVKGRHEVDGTTIYVNGAEYDTKDPAKCVMEAHRKYVDVMLMLEGEETIAVCQVDTLKHVTTPYDEKIEALLADPEPGYTAVHMRPGDVTILFPEDAHAPGMQVGAPCHVRKLIGKVAVD